MLVPRPNFFYCMLPFCEERALGDKVLIGGLQIYAGKIGGVDVAEIPGVRGCPRRRDFNRRFANIVVGPYNNLWSCNEPLQVCSRVRDEVVSRVTELEGHCTETSDRNMKK